MILETGKGSWRDGVNVRDSDRDNTSRGKHLRDDLRDDRYSVLTNELLSCDLTGFSTELGVICAFSYAKETKEIMFL